MALVRPTGSDNVVPATVAAIDQLEKLTGMLNILLAGGISAINCGTATITWPGASTFSNTLDVPHGLPNVGNPKVFVAIANATGSAQLVTIVYQAGGPIGTARVFAATTDGSSPSGAATTGICWIAMN